MSKSVDEMTAAEHLQWLQALNRGEPMPVFDDEDGIEPVALDDMTPQHHFDHIREDAR